jgi:exodeoxyribonuclease VII small subunit
MAARPKKPSEDQEPGFEDRLVALEAIVRELEGEGLTLEQSLARYQQGVAHVSACRALLDAAEQRLVELVEAPGGGVRERPLKVTEQGLAVDASAASEDDDGDPVP